MATIIDSLIVTLGLDASSFKKGKEETDSAMKQMQGSVGSAAASMVSSLRKVTLEFFGLFLAMRSVGDIVRFFGDLNRETRQLGIESKNVGLSASELRNWQNVAELAGGKAGDVTRTIMTLQQSLFGMKFLGQVNDQIITLARLGVQVRDTAGQMVPFRDIMFQIAAIMEKRKDLSRPEKEQWLLAAGFDQGSINAVLAGTDALRKYLATAEEQHQITEQQVDAAGKLDIAWTNLKQSSAAAATELLTNMTPAVTELLTQLSKDFPHQLENLSKWLQGDGGQGVLAFFHDLAAVIHTIGAAIDLLSGKAIAPDSLLGKILKLQADVRTKEVNALADAYASVTSEPDMALGRSADRSTRNHNPLNLKIGRGQDTVPHDSQGFRIFSSDSEGLAAGLHQLQLYSARGWDTIRKVVSHWAPASDGNNTQAYISAVSKQMGKDPDAPLSSADYQQLMQAMSRQERSPTAPIGQAVPSAVGAAAGAGATPAARASTPPVSRAAPSSSVQIGSISIATQATDAYGIFADAQRAAQRKLTLAQADRGLA